MSSPFTHLIMKFQAVIYRTDTLTTDRANQASDPEKWDFSPYPTIDLEVTFDGGALQIITLDSSLFANAAEATAEEVIAQIEAAISDGFAIENGDHQIIVATNTVGESGSVLIGGDAGVLLGFQTEEAQGGAYDRIWGAPKPVADGTQTGAEGRRERAPVTQLCQLGRDEVGKRTLTAGGESDKSDFTILLKKDLLAAAGLMDDTGLPHLHIGDRIAKILQRNGAIALDFPDPPGMWITKVEPVGYGLTFFGNAEVNLFRLHVSKDREIETE